VSTEWVVLELTPQGEDEDPDVLKKAFARIAKGGEVFIPASVSIVGDSRIVYKLIDNYVFVRRTFSDAFFLRLGGTRYVSCVLTKVTKGNRKIACVSDLDIAKMRHQIRVETEQGIEVGDTVEVMSGPYRGITGQVIEEIPEKDSVQIFISLRSKQAIVTLPRSFMRFVSKEKGVQPSFSLPFLNKITRTREWVAKVRPLFLWVPAPVSLVQVQYSKMNQIEGWMSRGRDVIKLLVDPPSPTSMVAADGSSLSVKYDHVQRMNGFIERAPVLFHLPRVTVQDVTCLEAKYLEFQWLQDIITKITALQGDIEGVERSLPDWKPIMAQNLIFDGHNLAYRIVNALRAIPNQLMDKDGNPTSLVFGFLRSLAALKKRFDRANIYVVWDGSKQRRASVFPEYKAQRPESGKGGEISAQMLKLREVLSLLGVIQAYNPEEETDDLIACLVRGRLKGQQNVIVSTDRDFLQLVTYTDLLLVPKVSSRQEILYDPDQVMLEYGVPPNKMVHLRALLGDQSDNFPGISRVPRKVLAALLNTHGSLTGLFASSLAGITLAQYEKLQAFQQQAHLNLQLMTLKDDVECPITEAIPSQEAASVFLQSLGIQSEPIVGVFFPPGISQGFSKFS
jgi:5'-3' exonuclease/transcription antitermination factor NusG